MLMIVFPQQQSTPPPPTHPREGDGAPARALLPRPSEGQGGRGRSCLGCAATAAAADDDSALLRIGALGRPSDELGGEEARLE